MILCCLYLQLGLATMAGHRNPPPPSMWWAYDINQVVNPYGSLEIGWDYPLRKDLHVELALHHISSLPVNDFGTNTAEVRVRWYPFEQ